MVVQNAKKMGLRFEARIQREIYNDLFTRRLEGERLYINKAMEESFLKSKDKEDLAIAKKIEKWHEIEITRLESELFKQKTRLNNAERDLNAGKITKKAQNDQRIATDKIEKATLDLKRHKTSTLTDSDSRIFPFHYVTTLALDDKGKKIIMPMRYHMRPHDKDESFDREFNGCYNARFDNLSRVNWWKDSLGKRHGVILVSRFYENVDPKIYAKKNKLSAEEKKSSNLVLCFEPDDTEYMIIPVLWDVWRPTGHNGEGRGRTAAIKSENSLSGRTKLRPGGSEGSDSLLYSCALITDEPAPEIAAAGHDRTPIFLKESAVDAWLNAKGDYKDIKEVLMERERPHYSHKVVSAA